MTAAGKPERPGLLASLRSLPRPVWILAAGTFVNRFGSFVVPFLVIYVRALGYSVAQAGLAASAFGVGSLTASAIGGWLTDRIGRRSTIAVSMFSTSAAMLVLWRVHGLVAFAILAGVVGLTGELARPAGQALIADLVPAGDRVPAYALHRLAINAGWAAGLAVAGFLAERSFSLLFVGDALTSAIYGVIALRFLPPGERSPRGAEAGARPRGELVRALRAEPRFLLFLGASVLAALVYFQSTSTYALHIRDSGLSNAVYGLLLSLNGVVIVIVELPLAAVTMRLPARGVIAVGVLFTGLGFGMLPWAHRLTLLVISMVILTFGEMVAQPVASGYVADLAPPGLQGRFQGAWFSTYSIAVVVGPAAGAAIYGVSPRLLWLGCAGLTVASAALIVASPRPPSRSRALPEDVAPDIPAAEV